jgi:hypothetical protein
MTPDDKDAVLDLARANLARADLTPDELPAIEGRVEAFIRWTDPCNTKPFSGSSLQLVSDLRALLKAYQEQRRALEEAPPVVPVGVSREEIARIIEPVAWEALDVYGQDKAAFIGLTTDHSIAKADAIIAAIRPTDTGRE